MAELPIIILHELLTDLGPPTLPILGNLHQIPRKGSYLKYLQSLPERNLLLTHFEDSHNGRRNTEAYIPSSSALGQP